MELDDVLKLLLAGASLTAGAFFTALRAKITSTKYKNWLHASFYGISVIIIIGAVIVTYCFWNEIFAKNETIPDSKNNLYATFVIALSLLSSIGLIWVTFKFLVGKYQYTVDKLNPIVNKFSRNADKENIKLLAGDLDFFGKTKDEIDKNSQYQCLKDENFKKIQILCTPPISYGDKERYGKIITDFPRAELRYYKPSHADLKVRGRIKTLNNVPMLLIYNKILPGQYQAIELNTAETEGAHYSGLWNLIWELADTPTQEQLSEYREIYQKSIS
ncbi:MAG: hypothetical protein H6577_06410 [Lewinellaceae bacterium]|nr:hypothetical protein [Saprospiraceae bacterium]MCB9337740.1 hypothetical protein [Lewinellaceae bacterium]